MEKLKFEIEIEMDDQFEVLEKDENDITTGKVLLTSDQCIKTIKEGLQSYLKDVTTDYFYDQVFNDLEMDDDFEPFHEKNFQVKVSIRE